MLWIVILFCCILSIFVWIFLRNMARNTGKPSPKGKDLISELQEAIRLRGGPAISERSDQHQQPVRRQPIGITQQPIPGSPRGDRAFISPRSPGPRRSVIPPAGAGDLTSAIAREIATKGHELRPAGERRMREVRSDASISSPPPTPSRAHLRRVSDGGGRHIDYGDDRG